MSERRIQYERERGAPYTPEERLQILTDLLARFEAPDATYESELEEERAQPWYTYGPLIHDFLAAAETFGWRRDDIDWVEWQRTYEAERMFSDLFYVQVATEQELAALTTYLINKERTFDGMIAGAFEKGIVREIVRRGLELERKRQKKERGGLLTRLFRRG